MLKACKVYIVNLSDNLRWRALNEFPDRLSESLRMSTRLLLGSVLLDLLDQETARSGLLASHYNSGTLR